jgi:hypothetical protein
MIGFVYSRQQTADGEQQTTERDSRQYMCVEYLVEPSSTSGGRYLRKAGGQETVSQEN